MKIDKELDIEKPKYVETPEVPRRSGRRKNTKRWCKGKVGREHNLVVRRMADRHGWSRRKCGPWPWGSRAGTWWCLHEIACETCGKVTKMFLGDDCPDKPSA